MPAKKPLTPNMRFGRLVVLSELKHPRYLCRCDCGAEKEVHARPLISGVTLSCGCLKAELLRNRRLKHGHAVRRDGSKGTRTYRIWSAMRTRCSNLRASRYERYGGRGVDICERWKAFENFLADMGPCPEGMSIERTNNDGNYEPGNCSWATRKQQARNQSNSKMITFRGERRALPEWTETLKIPYDRTKRRLNDGWSVEDAFSP